MQESVGKDLEMLFGIFQPVFEILLREYRRRDLKEIIRI